MRPVMSSAISSVLCRLAMCLLLASSMLAQSAPTSPASASTAATLADPAAYVASQFGPSFKLDATVLPMFGDLDGDGNEDLVLVGRSSTPLLSQGLFGFKVADPYDAYYGTGNPRITSQFTLHFDGSSRSLLIVFGWRLPPSSKQKRKFVLINTPFETVSMANLRFKKKKIQAIEAVDRTTLHSLVFWDGSRWHWSAQGMEGD